MCVCIILYVNICRYIRICIYVRMVMMNPKNWLGTIVSLPVYQWDLHGEKETSSSARATKAYHAG